VSIDSILASEGEKLTCIHERLLKVHGHAVVDVTTAQ
jgi:hypothetical protein